MLYGSVAGCRSMMKQSFIRYIYILILEFNMWGVKMIEKPLRKSLAFGMVILFVGSSFFPIMSDTNIIKAETNDVINSKSLDYEKYQENSDSIITRGFEGIASDGSYLWLAKSITNEIYKLDLNLNEVSSFPSPGNFTTGLAWDGEYLWNADWEDDKIYKLTPSGMIVDIYDSPAGDPYGLAWDGEYLWHTDTGIEIIYKLNESETSGNLDILSTFSSPGLDPVGLTWDGEYLWNADRKEDQIYSLDPLQGCSVVCSFDAPSLGPRGLAWDGEDMWYTDLNQGIFKINVSCEPPNTPSRPCGPNNGFTGVNYTYSTSTIDPGGDDVKFGWDWDGDYQVDNWTGFYPSGRTVSVNHYWSLSGTYDVRVIAEDTDRGKSEWSDPLSVIISYESNLDCSGKLNWNRVKPGTTVKDNFTISNIGGSDSELDWKVLSYPDWGTWTFTPKSGSNLKSSDGEATVEVILVVPNEKVKKFSGEVIVINEGDTNDICKIPISLTTPKNKGLNFQIFFLRFLEKYLQLFPILRFI